MTETFTPAMPILFDKINKQREMRREELHTFFNNKDIQNISASLRALANKQNKVTAFDFAHKNEIFHSDVIAHILEPNASHALGNTPMHLFIELLNKVSGELDIIPKNFDDATVTRETRHVDILIRNDKNKCKECIIIENKIRWAPDQCAQLARYYDAQKRDGFTVNAVVYITPHKSKQPEEQTFGNDKDIAKEIKERLVVLYAYPQRKDDELNLSHGWVRKLSAEAVNTHDDIDTILFLRQYFLCLEKEGQDFMSEQAEQDFTALLKTEKNKVNPSYFEIARGFTSRTIHICRCVHSILKENLTACMQKENLYECFGEPRMHKQNCLYFCFVGKGEEHHKIELYERNWGESWSIEIANPEGSDNIDRMLKIIETVPHPKITPPNSGGKIFIGTWQGFKYVGEEDAYHDTVIRVLRAFHTHYNGDIKVAP